MGELEGIRNAWGYVEGGTGAVSAAIARSAAAHGAVICTESVSEWGLRTQLHSESSCFSACDPDSDEGKG